MSACEKNTRSLFKKLPIFDHKTTEWASYKTKLTLFLMAHNIKENGNATLVTHLSYESGQLLRNLALPKHIYHLKYTEMIELFDNYFKQKECTFLDKEKFFEAKKSPDESLREWAARLQKLASPCSFGDALETIVRDRFVIGLASGPERDKLFEEMPASLPLARALDFAEKAACTRHAQAVVVRIDTKVTEQFLAGILEQAHARADARRGRARAARAPGATACSACGFKNHKESQCRYKTHKCKKCTKKGHLEKVCGGRPRGKSSANNAKG